MVGIVTSLQFLSSLHPLSFSTASSFHPPPFLTPPSLSSFPLLLFPSPPSLPLPQSLWGSTSVCKVLGLILALGNIMNAGNRTRGQADGFDIEVLGKLTDVRTSDGSCSLLQYVVRYYVTHVDQVCDVLPT